MALSIISRPPTAEEYEMLCRAVGWRDDVNFAVSGAALAASLFHVVAEIDGEIVGMARVVGDGAMFFYVQDVVVAPPHQRKGVGARLIRAIRDWLIANAPLRAQAFVFEAEGRRDFYRKLGFEPTGKGLQAFVDVWRRSSPQFLSRPNALTQHDEGAHRIARRSRRRRAHRHDRLRRLPADLPLPGA